MESSGLKCWKRGQRASNLAGPKLSSVSTDLSSSLPKPSPHPPPPRAGQMTCPAPCSSRTLPWWRLCERRQVKERGRKGTRTTAWNQENRRKRESKIPLTSWFVSKTGLRLRGIYIGEGDLLALTLSDINPSPRLLILFTKLRLANSWYGRPYQNLTGLQIFSKSLLLKMKTFMQDWGLVPGSRTRKGRRGNLNKVNKVRMVFIMTILVNCSLGHNYHLSLGKREPGSFTTRKWGGVGGGGWWW